MNEDYNNVSESQKQKLTEKSQTKEMYSTVRFHENQKQAQSTHSVKSWESICPY